MKAFGFSCAAVLLTIVICLVARAPADNPVPGNAPRDDSNAVDADIPGEPKQLSDFMRKKLHASNLILEGLVTDRLAMVESGAKVLLDMSDAEQWRASNDALYLQYSRAFHDSVETLIEKAERKSIDGVALAWMDVTMNCVQCHEWVRNVMIADNLDALQPSLDRKGLSP